MVGYRERMVSPLFAQFEFSSASAWEIGSSFAASPSFEGHDYHAQNVEF